MSREAFGHALAEWIETPSLSPRRAEREWPEVARRLVADLRTKSDEPIPA